jgi:hypothetical protein
MKPLVTLCSKLTAPSGALLLMTAGGLLQAQTIVYDANALPTCADTWADTGDSYSNSFYSLNSSSVWSTDGTSGTLTTVPNGRVGFGY